jgi:ferrous iron transport protein B
MTTFTIALAGNPNVGKSTLFNSLTGSRQHVGNWPGKTVEKKEGRTIINGTEILVVDLPGTYSLTAYSIEEIIARDFIVNERPNAVVAVVDAANLERNLYLVAQIIELEMPVIVALNMADLAQKRGIQIDPQALSKRLGGTPVIETVGNRGIGLDALKEAIFAAGTRQAAEIVTQVHYGPKVEEEISTLHAQIESDAALSEHYNPRWLAIKLLEDDTAIREAMQAAGQHDLLHAADAANEHIFNATGDDVETLIADRRYLFIAEVVGEAVVRRQQHAATLSDKLDAILTHRIWGLPIFLLLMWIVFQFTANVSAPFLDWVDGVIGGPITNWAAALLEALSLDGTWVAALAIDGVIAGVGGILVFVPVLMFLYLAIAILEDSGYMARAAFVMDRVMRAMGLHGKSFLPMIVGFGCTVPAIYATRTLENERDRKLTGFLTTFMSCGARLPVYVVFGAAFFGANSGNLVFGMYVLGIVVALIVGYVMKHTIYRNEPPPPFVLELPPYRTPNLRSMWTMIWERTGGFLRKAGTIILVSSIVIWFLMALPVSSDDGEFNDVRAEDSIFGTVSGALAPVFEPAGFGSWEASGSLITGFIAKEVVIGTMSQIYVDEADPAADETDEPDEPRPSFGEDLSEIVLTFGEASILTVQETVNIVPRTANLVPFVQVGEADWLAEGDVLGDYLATLESGAGVADAEDELVTALEDADVDDAAEQVAALRARFEAGDDTSELEGTLAGALDEESTTDLEKALVGAFNDSAGSSTRGDLAALAFNVFVLLYVPCMVAVAAMRQEFGWRWMFYQIAFTSILAWAAAVVIFQGGLLLGLG